MSPPHDSEPLELPARAHQEFVELLAEVDAALAETTEAGTAYTLFTVGGFVMGSRNAARFTQDIDVATRIPAPVAAAAKKVAEQHRMNGSWLNDQVSEMIQTPVPAGRFVEVFRGRHLLVYGADDGLMLALKLMSGREQDLADIMQLAQRTGRTSTENLLDAWDEVFGGSPSVAQQRHFVASLINDDVLPEMRRLAAPGPAAKRPAAPAEPLVRQQSSWSRIKSMLAARRRQQSPNDTNDDIPTAAAGTRPPPISSDSKCGASTQTGDPCGHPAPRPGGACAAGHCRA